MQEPLEQWRGRDRRRQRALVPAFRGDPAASAVRLKAKECPAAETVSRKTLRDLSNQVEVARSN